MGVQVKDFEIDPSKSIKGIFLEADFDPALWGQHAMQVLEDAMVAHVLSYPKPGGETVPPVPTGCEECAFTGKITLLTSVVPCACQENQCERNTEQ